MLFRSVLRFASLVCPPWRIEAQNELWDVVGLEREPSFRGFLEQQAVRPRGTHELLISCREAGKAARVDLDGCGERFGGFSRGQGVAIGEDRVSPYVGTLLSFYDRRVAIP